MSYLLAQIFVCLLVAGLIGLIIGCLFCRSGCKKKLSDNDKLWSEKLNNCESAWKSKMDTMSNEQKNVIENSSIEISLLKDRVNQSKSESKQLHSEIELLKSQLNSLESGKPELLLQPREGGKDNLKLIKGIGNVLEKALNNLGIYHFYQIASWNSKQVSWIDEYLAFPGRVEREEWIKQAKILSLGKETAFSNRVQRGEVPTSIK